VTEARNPFYILLLVAGLLFVVTALMLTVDLFLEMKTSQVQPLTPFREYLRSDGWQLLLYELGAVVVLAVASMGLDRFRRLQNDRAAATIPPVNEPQQTSQ
jgi:hypothetical protein